MKQSDMTRLLRRFDFPADRPEQLRLDRKMATCYREFLRSLRILESPELARTNASRPAAALGESAA